MTDRSPRLRAPFQAGWSWLSLAVGLFFVVTTIIGAVRWYSPVPWMDMWDGYLQFYFGVTKGNWQLWFTSGSEHRLIFSRLLFWLDLRYFQGLSVFLITINLVLMTLLWAELAFAASVLLRPRSKLWLVIAALLLVPCFSWLQDENITWGFQNQFFAAYLVPLAAFLCVVLSLRGARRGLWFSASAALGVLSAGTMGNGTLALPLLIAMVVLTRQRVRARLLVLVPLTAAVLYLYYRDIEPGPTSIPSFDRVLEFGLGFLGGPFSRIFYNHTVAEVAGVAFIAAGVLLFIGWYRSAGREPMFLALLVFLAYIDLAGAGAALGRARLGIEAAFTGRYMTPTLLGWSTLTVLLCARYRDRVELRGALLMLAVLVPAAFLPAQLLALSEAGPALVRQRRLAALALDLSIRDRTTAALLYPDETVHDIAEEAKALNLSVFGTAKMIRARQYLGRSAESLGLVECQGSIDAIRPVAEDPNAAIVEGWVFDPKQGRVPAQAFLVAADGLVIGAVFSGTPRAEVASVLGISDESAGFSGYVRRKQPGSLKLFCVP